MAKEVKAHIAGTVKKITVKRGDEVEEGTVVAILEYAFAMEWPVEAEESGIVSEIIVAEGQQIPEGYPLVWLS